MSEPRCPLCDAVLAGTLASCDRCEADLAGYWRIAPLPEALFEEAQRRRDAGQLAAAARSAYAAVAFAPRWGEYRLLLARLLGELGEVDEAIEHTQVALGDEVCAAEAEELLVSLLSQARA